MSRGTSQLWSPDSRWRSTRPWLSAWFTPTTGWRARSRRPFLTRPCWGGTRLHGRSSSVSWWRAPRPWDSPSIPGEWQSCSWELHVVCLSPLCQWQQREQVTTLNECCTQSHSSYMTEMICYISSNYFLCLSSRAVFSHISCQHTQLLERGSSLS